MKRKAGIFLHPTSLPSPFGIGDMGSDAFRWIDLLARYKQSIWQVCPVGPVTFGYSPYMCASSFAGNPLLISPEKLLHQGLLNKSEIDSFPQLPRDYADFDRVYAEKERLFWIAFGRFIKNGAYQDFCDKEAYWLEDFALFMTIKKLHNGEPWNRWEPALRNRDSDALKQVHRQHERDLDYFRFLQFVFSQQWKELKSHANGRGVSILGDVPYYATYDSADAWASPESFAFDKSGTPLQVGGVPPDYFSEKGQRWGNPVYDWKKMKKNGYTWWIQRISRIVQLVDWLRIDHFRGFESFWAIPPHSETAVNGEWVPGPGKDFFDALQAHLGHIPIVAEDLGMITEAVHALRKSVGIPGMRVLQFAFDGGNDNPHRPHNIGQDSIIYTGTHDNDTTVGWLKKLPQEKKEFVFRYLGCGAQDAVETILRTAYASPADWCIIPLQDILLLDERHRLNIPGTSSGNWKWRFTYDMIREDRFGLAAHYTGLYGRCDG